MMLNASTEAKEAMRLLLADFLQFDCETGSGPMFSFDMPEELPSLGDVWYAHNIYQESFARGSFGAKFRQARLVEEAIKCKSPWLVQALTPINERVWSDFELFDIAFENRWGKVTPTNTKLAYPIWLVALRCSYGNWERFTMENAIEQVILHREKKTDQETKALELFQHVSSSHKQSWVEETRRLGLGFRVSLHYLSESAKAALKNMVDNFTLEESDSFPNFTLPKKTKRKAEAQESSKSSGKQAKKEESE
jgi:hypothetical protein